MEQLTLYKFPTSRTILNNKQEIDGYCEELKIGFEYQGEQHYRFVKNWHKTINQFEYKQKLDRNKKRKITYLKALGKIKHIIFIKYTQAASNEKLENYIIRRLNKIDSSLIKNNKINYADFYKNLSPLNELKEIIEKKGGKLLSKNYINSQTPLKVDCGKRHIFKMSSNSLKKECWCSHCAGNARLNLKYMQHFAEQNNALCKSSFYMNNYTPLEWECLKCKNKLKISYHNLQRRKYFCQNCTIVKLIDHNDVNICAK